MCQLLLALNDNKTINNNLFSWSTWFQLTDVANQLIEGIMSSKVGWWDMQVDLVVTK